ncbi:MAG: tetratricopeptide repeat protein [Desulfococcaceae bacterium]
MRNRFLLPLWPALLAAFVAISVHAQAPEPSSESSSEPGIVPGAESPAAPAESLLEAGVREYRAENYEEAAELLREAREAAPESSVAAFMLGMAHKQRLDFQAALPHLRDAVRLTPRIRDAVVELAYALLQLDRPGEARQWVELAEREEIFPARTAFLKGLILQKEGDVEGAVASFRRAKEINPDLAQSADYNIALTYLGDRQFAQARDQLDAAILFDPTSDLADFARRYRDALDRRIKLTRPLRFTVGVLGQYDSNLILEPSDPLAAGVSADADRETAAMGVSARVNYAPNLEGPWRFNAQYLLGGRFHHDNSTAYDAITNSLSVLPGYSFGRFSANLSGRVTHSLVRDPSYKEYVTEAEVGPLFRFLAGERHLLEAGAGYLFREYAPPLLADEDRDSDGFTVAASWIWLLGEDAFLNLRYEFERDNTDGANWENRGNRFSAGASLPVWESLSFQISGEVLLKDYDNVHTVFNTERDDEIYQYAFGLTWEPLSETFVILQHNRTAANSNLPVYDYRRSIYTLGLEKRF